jgi:CRISPR-associated protein Csd1
MIEAYRSGRPAAAIDPTAFHATALSANGGRAVVRDWLTTTVGEVQQKLGQWFTWQKMVAKDGKDGVSFHRWFFSN